MTTDQDKRTIAEALSKDDPKGGWWQGCEDCPYDQREERDAAGAYLRMAFIIRPNPDCPTCNGTGKVPAIGPDMPVSRLMKLTHWCSAQRWWREDFPDPLLSEFDWWVEGEVYSWGAIIQGPLQTALWSPERPNDFECFLHAIAEAIRAETSEPGNQADQSSIGKVPGAEAARW